MPEINNKTDAELAMELVLLRISPYYFGIADDTYEIQQRLVLRLGWSATETKIAEAKELLKMVGL